MDRGSGPKGVIIQAAVDWNFLKQRPHHFAEEFSRLGLPVLFIENTGTRVPSPTDARRLLSRLWRITAKTAGAAADSSNAKVEVLSPAVLPFPYLRAAQAYNGRYLARRIKSFLMRHRLTAQSVAMITYLATPLAASLTLDEPWHVRVYDVVSDPKHVEPRVAKSERRLLRGADFVLFASETLRRTYGESETRFKTFRDGFSVELLEESDGESNCIDVLPRARFLYLGGLNKKVWVEALEQLADAHPSASVLLMGPVTSGGFQPPQRSNVRILPPVAEYRDLARFLREADLGLIPYVPDEYVSPMYPAKLNEYLVFGLPIVATATPELAHLAAELGPGAVYLAESAKDFAMMAERALSENSPEGREHRMAFAARRTWNRQAIALFGILSGSSVLPLDRDKEPSAQ